MKSPIAPKPAEQDDNACLPTPNPSQSESSLEVRHGGQMVFFRFDAPKRSEIFTIHDQKYSQLFENLEGQMPQARPGVTAPRGTYECRHLSASGEQVWAFTL